MRASNTIEAKKEKEKEEKKKKKKRKERKETAVSLEKKREREKLHYIRDIIFAQRRSERVLFPSTNYTTVGHTTTIIRVT